MSCWYDSNSALTSRVQVTRHDIGDKAKVGTVSEAYPHLIFEGFTSKLGQRVANILKFLFPTPKDDSRRVLTFVNTQARLHAATIARRTQQRVLIRVWRLGCTNTIAIVLVWCSDGRCVFAGLHILSASYI